MPLNPTRTPNQERQSRPPAHRMVYEVIQPSVSDKLPMLHNGIQWELNLAFTGADYPTAFPMNWASKTVGVFTISRGMGVF